MCTSVQEVFRSINDRIKELERRRWIDDDGIVCECRDSKCADVLHVTAEEYRTITAVPGLFFVRSGHEDRAHERIIVGTGRYAVVQAGDSRSVGEVADTALAEAA